MKAWKRIAPTKVDKIGFRTVVTKHFVLGNGRTEAFQTYDREDQQYAGVIAVTRAGQVIIARQFRPGPEQIMEELPGGYVDPEDEGDITGAAARELEEETGYRAGSIEYLGKVYKDCYNNATWNYCLALDCEPNATGMQLESTEEVEVDLISIERFIENALQGRMTDAEAVLLAYERLRQLASRG